MYLQVLFHTLRFLLNFHHIEMHGNVISSWTWYCEPPDVRICCRSGAEGSCYCSFELSIVVQRNDFISWSQTLSLNKCVLFFCVLLFYWNLSPNAWRGFANFPEYWVIAGLFWCRVGTRSGLVKTWYSHVFFVIRSQVDSSKYRCERTQIG